MIATFIALLLTLSLPVLIYWGLQKIAARATFSYHRTALLTKHEAEFYGQLRGAVPWALVLPKTSMSALVQPQAKSGTRQQRSARARIAHKSVDFAVCRPDMSVICVIDLDARLKERDKNRLKDSQRESILSGAGIPTLHYKSRASLRPSAEQLKQDINSLALTAVARPAADPTPEETGFHDTSQFEPTRF